MPICGRRRTDNTMMDDLEPGDFSRQGDSGVWLVRTPRGDFGLVGLRSQVTLFLDGTITVPSSLLDLSCTWHGRLEGGWWCEI